MIPRSIALVAGTLVLAALGGAAPVAAATCYVTAPDDSAENIRLTPNGEVINRLRNGREVVVDYTRSDAKGRPWAYVSGEYNGKWRNWGFIFTESLDCY